MRIERMNLAHVAAAAGLERLCFSDPWSEKSIASELENPLSLWLVALEGGQVVGYVGSQTVLGWTDMMNLAVHPDYRRRHIGEALVEALIRLLKEQGNECLTLESGPPTRAPKPCMVRWALRKWADGPITTAIPKRMP